MDALAVALAVAAATTGAFTLSVGLRMARSGPGDLTDYLRSFDATDEELDEFEQLLRIPFLSRVLHPLGGRALRGVASLTPSNHLDRLHEKLLHAGLSGSIRAEELATAQTLTTVVAIGLGVAFTFISTPPPRLATAVLAGFPLMGFLGPQAWLERKVSARKAAIRRDLPDVLDLLAISVEAGTGFEGGLQVVCTNFTSPLAEELSRTLKEMELGLSRREALQNLKHRTEVPELSNFVLVLTQADALGMPIGRVLRAQSSEMRLKRRQWAREHAAKLPVKILFPLIFFIFPAVFVVVLGPAAASLMHGLG